MSAHGLRCVVLERSESLYGAPLVFCVGVVCSCKFEDECKTIQALLRVINLVDWTKHEHVCLSETLRFEALISMQQ